MLAKLHNQKGFTLVEVIVVAVIVAVLAAIAIPLYTGYVSTSRQNVVNNACGSLASFCAANRNSAGADLSGTYAGNAVINGASGTTWRVPADLDAVINDGTSTVTVNHTAGGETQSYNF